MTFRRHSDNQAKTLDQAVDISRHRPKTERMDQIHVIDCSSKCDTVAAKLFLWNEP